MVKHDRLCVISALIEAQSRFVFTGPSRTEDATCPSILMSLGEALPQTYFLIMSRRSLGYTLAWTIVQPHNSFAQQ